VGNEKIGD